MVSGADETKAALIIIFVLGLTCLCNGTFTHIPLPLPYYRFVVREAWHSRLCVAKKILTINGQFPGPTIYAYRGTTVLVHLHNYSPYNVTLHWHGAKQERYPWSDGPEYITQCPIKPGGSFKQKILIAADQEGTLWWHAHSDWSRATVHGAIIVYPKLGSSYPFPRPHHEVPIILGEWWKKNVLEVLEESVITGADPNVSDAFTINGQPGFLYPCSNLGAYKLWVQQGHTYLLRFINAAMNNVLFFSVANHDLTVVAVDGSYTKPMTRPHITISPGQTLDVLLHADQPPCGRYYMAARSYTSGNISFDNTTTTALLKYIDCWRFNWSRPTMPYLPAYNDVSSAVNFSFSLRSLANNRYPISVPLNITTKIISTVSINTRPCNHTSGESKNITCQGPNGTRLAASINNVSFVIPTRIDILQAYYNRLKGVFDTRFPNFPPLEFNYTAEDLPVSLLTPTRATKVKLLEYNENVEMVFQGTSLLGGLDHPMHIHGYNFYAVGGGLGNFDKNKDPMKYNLVDPPLRNTVCVPINGWIAIRFKANNPGVWFIHCHLERHLTWGMNTVLIVKDGKRPEEKMLPPPRDMPPC
ncbi:laccase-15-like [Impatiens glandulifera]|uniref:laccase-15-like n=1 Tax=Impatiens glandulifera TaxID=253017 RepID=UPI001FB165B0|nr:laccase-15-like [Impatiens glandulifera]